MSKSKRFDLEMSLQRMDPADVIANVWKGLARKLFIRGYLWVNK